MIKELKAYISLKKMELLETNVEEEYNLSSNYEPCIQEEETDFIRMQKQSKLTYEKENMRKVKPQNCIKENKEDDNFKDLFSINMFQNAENKGSDENLLKDTSNKSKKLHLSGEKHQ